ncbi:hypothetical protein [Paenibacillus sp. FSL R7-0331]|uniref:hypothetical protein n=1 Tax=Paenibacillus sp. FSL R7-0331 TaxID=1536773 RepID=UPI0004F816E7|nr:hypothetical protein [Paenibacillus sp. FSL R7-0331]AIQ52931.1 hypothetical protein R70331_16305 [Paenibacillus sp. FSL R7-0331]
MEFYNESSFFDLPHKRMVDDVMERNGPATEESFTPFNGCNFIIGEIMNGPRSRYLSLDEIKENIEEFPVADKPENINESDLVNYLRKKLTDLKNKIDAYPVADEDEEIQSLMYDPVTGESFTLSDVYVSPEIDNGDE